MTRKKIINKNSASTSAEQVDFVRDPFRIYDNYCSPEDVPYNEGRKCFFATVYRKVSRFQNI